MMVVDPDSIIGWEVGEGGSEIRGNGRGSFLQDPPLIFAKPGVANQIVTLLFLHLVPYFPWQMS